MFLWALWGNFLAQRGRRPTVHLPQTFSQGMHLPKKKENHFLLQSYRPCPGRQALCQSRQGGFQNKLLRDLHPDSYWALDRANHDGTFCHGDSILVREAASCVNAPPTMKGNKSSSWAVERHRADDRSLAETHLQVSMQHARPAARQYSVPSSQSANHCRMIPWYQDMGSVKRILKSIS